MLDRKKSISVHCKHFHVRSKSLSKMTDTLTVNQWRMDIMERLQDVEWLGDG